MKEREKKRNSELEKVERIKEQAQLPINTELSKLPIITKGKRRTIFKFDTEINQATLDSPSVYKDPSKSINKTQVDKDSLKEEKKDINSVLCI